MCTSINLGLEVVDGLLHVNAPCLLYLFCLYELLFEFLYWLLKIK